MFGLQLQKSLTPDFKEKCGNSPDISKGISQLGMYKFESSQVSQPVQGSGDPLANHEKGPPMAGFRAAAINLHLPNRRLGRAKSRKVSGRSREYSRFRETDVGDLVRSLLPTD
jgi:hypothetical protein